MTDILNQIAAAESTKELAALFYRAETAEQHAAICRREAELMGGPFYCADCGGLVSEGGMTIDPVKCCFFCRAD